MRIIILISISILFLGCHSKVKFLEPKKIIFAFNGRGCEGQCDIYAYQIENDSILLVVESFYKNEKCNFKFFKNRFERTISRKIDSNFVGLFKGKVEKRILQKINLEFKKIRVDTIESIFTKANWIDGVNYSLFLNFNDEMVAYIGSEPIHKSRLLFELLEDSVMNTSKFEIDTLNIKRYCFLDSLVNK